jgi:quinol-cytochrome oxidoreductase complex cytochrome b subunit
LYAILRAIPNKLFGLIGMFSVFLIFVSLPFWRSSIPNLNSF